MKENKKYSAPELEVIDIDCEDIIQTSGDEGLTVLPGTGESPGTGSSTGNSSYWSTGTPTEINYFE